MRIGLSFRIIGLLLIVFSTAMLPSLFVGLTANDGSADAFSIAFALNIAGGLALWLPTRNQKADLRIRDGFLVTALFWLVLGLFGAIPFALSSALEISATDAIFESISALTTTGATVIVGLDDLPQSILLYRQLLQWLGGIGIVVLAVAILPMLGIGGMQLYRAEIAGPSKDRKLTPRIAGTAKILFIVYAGLTLACAGAFYAAGMTGFDAIAHAFSTVAIGGFSTHDASMGYFDSDLILLICSFFMLISAINFGLHFLAFQRASLDIYRRDSETWFFLIIVALAVLVVCTTLYISSTLPLEESIVHGIFQTISIATTTGFTTKDFSIWPIYLPLLLLMLSFMGGCAGSTAGGMKAIRLLLIFKQGVRELKQLLHPAAVIPLKLDSRRVQPTIVSAVWSFFAVYMMCFVFLMLALLATGLNFDTAFSAVAATLNNLGPGLGDVASHYQNVPDVGKYLLCLAMLLGRLEVFTLLVIFTPAFWRP
jgi:trk system potassium uptake protein TrkH